MASARGLSNICHLLIELNADINCIDSAKKTPLYYALLGNHIDVIKLLLIKKACPWSDNYCNY